MRLRTWPEFPELVSGGARAPPPQAWPCSPSFSKYLLATKSTNCFLERPLLLTAQETEESPDTGSHAAVSSVAPSVLRPM